MKEISQHVTYEEATYSETAKRLGIDNTPNRDQVINMIITAGKVFEPMRVHFDVPIHVSSFYRSPKLNQAIGGSTTSQHMSGEAMDLDADKYDSIRNKHIFEYIKDNLEFDQLIAENVSEDKWADFAWVHVSYRFGQNRREAFLSELRNGVKHYYIYDPAKGYDIKLYRADE